MHSSFMAHVLAVNACVISRGVSSLESARPSKEGPLYVVVYKDRTESELYTTIGKC